MKVKNEHVIPGQVSLLCFHQIHPHQTNPRHTVEGIFFLQYPQTPFPVSGNLFLPFKSASNLFVHIFGSHLNFSNL